jgi:hypothetical protein
MRVCQSRKGHTFCRFAVIKRWSSSEQKKKENCKITAPSPVSFLSITSVRTVAAKKIVAATVNRSLKNSLLHR